ncbi:MAG: PAS domain-containing protein [Gallionella sp.]|nr:PAS domain-containing protein [Gallionella sp.]MDD4959599.1 PAS domain-containing protein [Gallionella sp.]
MRITTKLSIISASTAAALIVLLPILIWSVAEFKSAKSDYVLSNEIEVNFFERASVRDQYFLYREDRLRTQWEISKKISDVLLKQAESQFHRPEDLRIREQLHRSIEEVGLAFFRIVKNTEVLKTESANMEVYKELDKRLYSQLLLKSNEVHNLAMSLKEAAAERVERSYQHLILIVGLFAFILALVTILSAMQIRKLISRGLFPLHDGARTIANGDLNYRIRMSSEDEFSELAQSINTMTDELQTFTQQLKAEISEHKQAESTLWELTNLLQSIMENLPASIFWKDRESRYLGCNTRFALDAGRSTPEELIGKTDFEMTWKDQAELYRADDHATMASGIPKLAFEEPQTTPDGDMIWLRTSKVPLRDANNQIIGVLGFYQDITAYKLAENALRDSEIRYRSLVENSPLCIHELDLAGRLTSMNPAGLRMMGVATESDIRGMLYMDAVCEDNKAHIGALLDQAYKGESSRFEFKASGVCAQVFQSCFVPVKDNSGEVVKIMGITEDITKRKLIEDKVNELNRDFVAFLDNTSDFIYFKDSNSRIRFCSQIMANITGHTSWRDMIGKHDLEIFPEDVAKIYDEEELPIFQEGKPLLNKTNPYYDATGKLGWLNTSKWPLLDAEGKVVGLFGISRDITEQKTLEDQVHQLAFYDPLTKLANRRLFNDRLGQTMSSSKRKGYYSAVLFLDLDNFKPLNDIHGHAVGDLLLIEVADRLRNCVREIDTVGRFGGDEFVVLITELAFDHAESTSQAHLIAEKVRITLSTPYVLTDHHNDKPDATIVHHCTASIGVVVFINHLWSQDEILSRADSAMYLAKKFGRNMIHFDDKATAITASRQDREQVSATEGLSP